MRRRFERTTLLLNLINTAALAAGLVVVTVWGNGHDAQRVGAIIAAITGIFVILQVREEIEIERSKPRASSHLEVAGLSPTQSKALELEKSKRAGEESAMRQARLVLVAAIAMWLFLGEILHGFGDLALENVMSLWIKPTEHGHAAADRGGGADSKSDQARPASADGNADRGER